MRHLAVLALPLLLAGCLAVEHAPTAAWVPEPPRPRVRCPAIEAPDGPVPGCLLRAAETWLRHRVGDRAMERLAFNASASAYVNPAPECRGNDACGWTSEPYARVVHDFEPAPADAPRVPVEFLLDRNGGFVLDSRVPLPPCREKPWRCDVRVDAEGARDAARDAGLPAGKDPWSTGLGYHATEERLVWSVRAVTERSPDGDHEGEVAIVDAGTGAVIARHGYSLVDD